MVPSSVSFMMRDHAESVLCVRYGFMMRDHAESVLCVRYGLEFLHGQDPKPTLAFGQSMMSRDALDVLGQQIAWRQITDIA